MKIFKIGFLAQNSSSKVQAASVPKVTFDPAPFCLPYPVNPTPFCLPYPVPYPVMWGYLTGRGLTCQALLQRDRACYRVIGVFPIPKMLYKRIIEQLVSHSNSKWMIEEKMVLPPSGLGYPLR